MQLSIDMTIQHGSPNTLSSARFIACGKPGVGRVKIPFGRHFIVTCSALYYLKPLSLACLTQTDVLFASPAHR